MLTIKSVTSTWRCRLCLTDGEKSLGEEACTQFLRYLIIVPLEQKAKVGQLVGRRMLFLECLLGIFAIVTAERNRGPLPCSIW